jgi:uncharacterized protein (DUF1697 family)
MSEPNYRCFAFLRAINVGGHTVKMDDLRKLCAEAGLANVETFIASGNLIFETDSSDTRQLEKNIEGHLRQALGYPVATFIRSGAQLTAVASYQAFSPADLETAQALNVAFLSAPIDEVQKQKLMALKTDIDDFHVSQQEIYWLCTKKQSDSKFSNAVLEKTLGQPTTLRGIQTIRKMAAKYAE